MHAYTVVDAFTTTPLEGNPVAVFFDADDLSADTMQRITMEMHLSECTFVLRAKAGGDAHIRIFTPVNELPFAGHPLLGTAIALGTAAKSDELSLETGMGAIPFTLERRDGEAVGAEDTFTAMIVQQLEALGPTAEVLRYDEPYALDGYDLVVMGPGPGDPLAGDDPKIAALNAAVARLLDERIRFLAVCLSHQVLSLRLGFDLVRRTEPNQGVQRGIDLFGRRERVGYYNTFAAVSRSDHRDVPGVGRVRVSRDPASGEVDMLRGPHFASFQFHAESVLTVDGPRLFTEALGAVLDR